MTYIVQSNVQNYGGLSSLAGWQLRAISFRFLVSVQSFGVIENCVALITFDDQSLSMLGSQVVSHGPKALVCLVAKDTKEVVWACGRLIEQLYSAAC